MCVCVCVVCTNVLDLSWAFGGGCNISIPLFFLFSFFTFSLLVFCLGGVLVWDGRGGQRHSLHPSDTHSWWRKGGLSGFIVMGVYCVWELARLEKSVSGPGLSWEFLIRDVDSWIFIDLT